MKEIQLTQGMFAQVPDAVFEYLIKDNWIAHKNGNTYYAVRHTKKHEHIDKKRGLIFMHRVIWEYYNGPIPEGYEIDHKDRNGLNNLIDNLKCGPHGDNMKNKGNYKNNISGYPGVWWHKTHKKWTAYITVNCKFIHLYRGDSKEEAIAAREAGKLKYYGKSSEDSL